MSQGFDRIDNDSLQDYFGKGEERRRYREASRFRRSYEQEFALGNDRDREQMWAAEIVRELGDQPESLAKYQARMRDLDARFSRWQLKHLVGSRP